MILLIGFAFLAGIVTILSPCILPILPIVLSGSVDQSKRKPWGIVIGFILSFTFFTLFLTSIVRATGLSADTLRTLSVIIIFVFGVTLLIPKTQEILEQLFSSFASSLPQKQEREGFVGGLLIGLSIGLVWTPCVGPILASVISLALTGTFTGTAALITLAYSIGTAIPMLGVIYGGRKVFDKVPWLTKNTEKIQKAFGVIMIITAVAIQLNLDRRFQTYILTKFPQYGAGLTQIEDVPIVQEQLKQLDKEPIDQSNRGKPSLDVMEDDLQKAPELRPGGEWFNTEPLTLDELRGKVVLIDFWTYSCINCIRTLPFLKSWHQEYSDDGLVIIGVHTPEFEFEKDPSNVKQAITDFEIEYPVVQDNNYATWNAYNNRYWPAKYFIDKDGKIRWTHFGEGEYDRSEEVIRELLQETGSDPGPSSMPSGDNTIHSRTPELYLGYGRIRAFTSPENIRKDQSTQYSIPSVITANTFAYGGTWTITKEHAAASQGSRLKLNFSSKEVYLVMRHRDSEGDVRVLLDGEPVSENNQGEDVTNSTVTVHKDRLYHLVSLPEPGRHVLELEFLDDNIQIFALTFG